MMMVMMMIQMLFPIHISWFQKSTKLIFNSFCLLAFFTKFSHTSQTLFHIRKIIQNIYIFLFYFILVNPFSLCNRNPNHKLQEHTDCFYGQWVRFVIHFFRFRHELKTWNQISWLPNSYNNRSLHVHVYQLNVVYMLHTPTTHNTNLCQFPGFSTFIWLKSKS